VDSKAGWLVMADPPLAHRPNPDRLRYAMCGIQLDPAVPVALRREEVGRECGVCCVAIGRARKKAYRAETAGQRKRRLAKGKVTDPDDVDRLDRARMRGTSVRTVNGGLPTPGRR
jgi:hypothetical protein